MGNQLCPAKVIIQQFSEIEKGDKSYSMFFRSCLKSPIISDHEIECNRDPQLVDIYEQPQNLVLQKAENHLDLQKTKDPQCYQKTQDLKIEKKQQISSQQLSLEQGSRYVGQTLNGIPHGEGEQFYSDGDHYRGTFQNGCKNGKGIYTFANSQIYSGEFRMNMMCGSGVFQFLNGDRYEGQFLDNVRSGKGKYIPKQPNAQGILFFEGEYKNDLKDGLGKVRYKDYEMSGYWKNGLYEFHLPNKL